MTDRYAVLGNPVKHSLSPHIHAMFAAQTGQKINYEAIEIALDDFNAHVQRLHDADYQGMNVTVPFKEQAWQLSETRSERAELAGAVNTLIRTETGWRGDNTDGIGLLRDLTQNLKLDLKDQRILILGAGGAVRGVIKPLLEAQPANIHIANRTAEKATKLASLFDNYGNVTASGLSGPFNTFDLIINGTAASLQGKVPDIPDNLLTENGSCYDMMYSKSTTAFQQWAQQRRAKIAAGGLGMLVEQAAESFYLWRGVKPETRAVLTNFGQS